MMALFTETKSINLCSWTQVKFGAKLSVTQGNDGILISALKFKLKTHLELSQVSIDREKRVE